jgi:regulator of sigma E protease
MLIRIIQLLFSLSILVFIHEFGHFLFSRIAKVRVEKFYLFFNPSFSILRAKRVNGKWRICFFAKNLKSLSTPVIDFQGNHAQDTNGKFLYNTVDINTLPDDDWRKYPENTEFGIGWLPLGGYCKIAGMVDESMDNAQMSSAPKSYEYRSVSVWKRLPIITAGVVFNFLLALFIYAAVLFTWGEEYIPLENYKAGFEFSEAARTVGFEDGDKLLSADGKYLERLDEENFRTILQAKEITVLRNGKQVQVQIPADFFEKIIFNKEYFLLPRLPFVADSVVFASPAQRAGLQKGDSLVAINDTTYYSFFDFAKTVKNHPSQAIAVQFYRNGVLRQTEITPDSTGIMGIYPRSFADMFGTQKISYSLGKSIPVGISKGIKKLTGYVSDFKYMFKPEGLENLGGFKSIGMLFDTQWNWKSFWEMTAFLSIILAFMNILPIPGLDGGHLLFLLFEIITGRKPSDKFLQKAQLIGMVFLLALMIFANANDFLR